MRQSHFPSSCMYVFAYTFDENLVYCHKIVEVHLLNKKFHHCYCSPNVLFSLLALGTQRTTQPSFQTLLFLGFLKSYKLVYHIQLYIMSSARVTQCRILDTWVTE
mgnify:CR=1 FL=1